MATLKITATVGAAPTSASVTISANRSAGIAPAQFMFVSETAGFDEDSDERNRVRRKWTFGDAGSTFPALDSNMPHGTGANITYGPESSHLFDPTPGFISRVYTVTCEATGYVGGSLVTVSDTFDVTISDPDVIYSGNQTICVDSGADLTYAQSLHPGCQCVATLDEARTANTSGVKRVLMRRGQTFAPSDSGSGWTDSTFQMGAYGTGDRPRIDCTLVENERNGVLLKTTSGDQQFWGFAVTSDYDPTTPTPVADRRDVNAFQIENKIKTGRFVTIHDVQGSGLYRFAQAIGSFHIMMSSIDGYQHGFTNHFDFGLYWIGSGGWFAAIGCRCIQNPAARMGDGNGNSSKYSTNPYAHHGQVRISRVIEGAPVVISNCDFGSFNSWAYNGVYAMQPNLRINVGGEMGEPRVTIMQNRLVGGVLNFPSTNTYTHSYPMRLHIDKNWMLLWNQGGRAISSVFGGTHAQNNIVVQPDLPESMIRSRVFGHGSGGYETDADDGGDYGDRYEVYLGYPDTDGEIKYRQNLLGNTVLFLNTSTDTDPIANPLELQDFIENDNYPSDGPNTRNPSSVTLGGNLVHAPLWGITADVDVAQDFSDLDQLPVGQSVLQLSLDASYAVSDTFLTYGHPQSLIPVPAGEVVPIDDFFGDLRDTANPTLGAINYAA